MKLSDKKVMLIGFGIFEGFFAQKLAEEFKEALVYIPYEQPFPSWRTEYICKGLPNVSLVDAYEDHEDEVDLFVFLDIGFSGMQRALRKKGKRVFGVGEAEKYEMDREFLMRTLGQRGLPVPKYEMVTGIDALREKLRNLKDKWVKLPNKERAVMESFHHKEWKKSITTLDELAYKLGPVRDIIKFMICDPIPGVEFGVEKFQSNGDYLEIACYGPEIKASGYEGHIIPMAEMPQFLRIVDERMLPEWRRHKVCGHTSTEVRAGKDKKSYFTDGCQRFGSPPGEAICNAYKNLPQIIYAVAGGEKIKPEPVGEWVAEICIYSPYAKDDALPVDFPEKQADNLKFRRLCKVGSQYYVLPEKLAGDRICAAVGVADSREEAQFIACEAAESLDCGAKDYSKTVFEEIEEEIEKAQKFGLLKEF
jgi:hypothetical protein